MANILLFILSITVSFSAYSQRLEKVKKAYQEKRITNPEKYLGTITPKDPDFLDTQRFLINYYSSFDDINQANKQAKIGYKYSEPNSPNSYFFWDKFHSNEFYAEAFIGYGSPYNSQGISLTSSHKYYKKNWLIFNLQNEQRIYYKTGNIKSSGTSIGLSHVLVLDTATYIQSSFNLSLVNSFYPNYSVDNEIYYSPDSNTYSLGLKYSSYDKASIIMLTPHYRYDWEDLYVGARLYAVFSEIEPVFSGKVYLGYKFNYQWKTEVSYTSGQTLEDGLLANKTYFNNAIWEVKYRFHEDHEIGARVEYYKSRLSDQNKLFLNYLYKY